jgi:hypothetical protein
MIPKSANRFSVNIMRQRKNRGSWQRKKSPALSQGQAGPEGGGREVWFAIRPRR